MNRTIGASFARGLGAVIDRSLGLALRVRSWFVLNVFALSLLLFIQFAYDQSNKPSWWIDIYPLAVSLLIGSLVSFLFYFLVVYVPERRKRNIIKSNLEKVYKQIKRTILYQVVFASIKGGRDDITPDEETIDKLMSPNGFKDTFQAGHEADEGFYAFENQMSYDGPEFREIILNLQILSYQIEYILHNYPIFDQKLFDFFKRLQIFLIKIQASGPGYDESKPLCGFVWEIYAGWDFITGDRGYDIIEKMIEDI